LCRQSQETLRVSSRFACFEDYSQRFFFVFFVVFFFFSVSFYSVSSFFFSSSSSSSSSFFPSPSTPSSSSSSSSSRLFAIYRELSRDCFADAGGNGRRARARRAGVLCVGTVGVER
jgi:hypothetical protein